MIETASQQIARLSSFESCVAIGCMHDGGHDGYHEQPFDFNGKLQLRDNALWYVSDVSNYKVDRTLWALRSPPARFFPCFRPKSHPPA